MELNEARQAVYARWLDQWKDGAEPLCPFVFDNEVGPLEDVWARCSVRSMPGGQQTLGGKGNRKFHRKGLIRVECYTQPGLGMDGADRLHKAAQDIFEADRLGEVKTYDADVAEIGLVEEDRWFLSTVEVSFDYEAIK